MDFWRGAKRRMRNAAAPCIFLALTGYFTASAFHGSHGLDAAPVRQAMLEAAKLDLSRADAEKAMWERRVAAMRDNKIDRDELDERTRAMLNLSQPNDVIVLYPPGQKLF